MKSEDKEFELNLPNVLGPVLYTHPLPEKLGTMYAGDFLRFFIKIDHFKSISEKRPLNMLNDNIYSINTPLPHICSHQGIISKINSKPEEPLLGSRVFNIYDEEYNLTNSKRFEIKNVKDHLVGVDLIIQITDSNIESESKDSFALNGIIVVFGQAVYSSQVSQPNNIYDTSFDMDLLSIIKSPESQEILPFFEDRKWCRFSLTGEPVYCYDVLDFYDEGLPFNLWVSQRLHSSTLYFDTDKDRFELSMMKIEDKIILKLAKLNQPVLSLSQIRSDGTPVRQASKTIIFDQIEWEDLIFNQDSISVNDEIFSPVMSYFWAKRKRSIS